MARQSAKTCTLCDLTAQMHRVASLDSLLEVIVKGVTAIFGLKGALVRVMDRKCRTMEVAASHGLSNEYLAKGPINIDKSSIDREVLAGNTVVIEDISKDSRVLYPRQIKQEGIRSIASIPLKTDKHVVGILRIYSTTGRDFSARVIEDVEKLAELSVQAIEAILIKERDLRLKDFSMMVNSSLSLTEVLETAAKLATEAMRMKACTIKLYDERRHEMVAKAIYGVKKSFIERSPSKIEELPIDQELLEGKVVYIPNVTADSRFVLPELAREEGLVSVLCVPLTAKERVLGTMRLYTATEYEFSEDEKSFVHTIANQVAIAVSNALLYERLHTLFLVTSSLSKSLNKHQTFKAIVEGAAKALNAQGASLFIWDPEASHFTLEEVSGVTKGCMAIIRDDYVERSEDATCGDVVIRRHLEADLPKKCAQAMAREGINSVVTTPMKAKEHLTGILQIYFTTTRKFTHDELEFCSTLASEAAVAIENAKLYEAVTKKYDHMVEDVFLWYDGASRAMED
ncbi:MAG: GAF domain-containing protein [Candidatus Eremiobacteraeota bacterium]|nr:GAF domain-containing protein [Candidatus Eremiobacteraeota bacterium]